jgi:hypothetical protein
VAIIVETSSEDVEVSEYEKFRKPIQDIINFTDTIDERYRVKCFEVLLTHTLFNGVEPKQNFLPQENKTNAYQTRDYPLDLKTFLQQYMIPEETINKLFLREKGEVKPLYKITEKRKANAQIQVALLTAFENALSTPIGAFEFSMKTARQRCTEYCVYDGNNFIFNFKTRAGLFSNLDNEVVKLTPIGRTELANFVIWLSKQ